MEKNIFTIDEKDLTNLEEKLFGIDTIIMSAELFLSLYKERNNFYEMSIRDPLTKVYNRRGFFLLADQQIKFLKRKKFKSYIWYFDIDKFKELNDNNGHEIGDETLKYFSAVLKESFRESDIIGRLGGDEFAVFVVNGYDGIEDIIKARLADNLETLNQIINNKISISIGITDIDPIEDIDLDKLIAEADKKMYENKRKK